MANTLAPFGLRILGNQGGAAPNFGMIQRQIASNDTAAIGLGDPVKGLNTGYIARWTAGTAVSQLVGVFAGCQYLNASTGEWVFSPYWPGGGNSGVGYALLYPCQLSVPPQFLVQSSGTAITLADIGMNADMSMGSVNTTTKTSGASLNQASIADTATLPFRITSLYEGEGNGSDAASSYNWVVVTANVYGSTGI